MDDTSGVIDRDLWELIFLVGILLFWFVSRTLMRRQDNDRLKVMEERIERLERRLDGLPIRK
jgi:hypothetical protein